jgi:ribosomal protein S18 acetylase RimI-like enzyme
MSSEVRHGISVVATLSPNELVDLRVLIDVAVAYDGFSPRWSWDEIAAASDEPVRLLSYYQGKLVGCLVLSGLQGVEVEATGLVHPAYRRQGIFSALVEQARELCIKHGVLGLILVSEEQSLAAKAFAQSRNAPLLMAEHLMQLDQWVSSPQAHPSFSLRIASLDDAEVITDIRNEDNGFEEHMLLPLIRSQIEQGSRTYVVGEAENRVVGTANIDWIEGLPYIYGFVIRPQERGKGFGRLLLRQLLDLIVSEYQGPILLEVETDNSVAINLYHSLGFRVITTYEYYRVDC